MFWNRFYYLCCQNGTKPNPLGKEIGISSGVITKWKNGALPNGENLIKIADYLNCSVDYLLCRTDNPNISTEAYIGGANNGVQAVKNGTVTINQAPDDKDDEITTEFLRLFSAMKFKDKLDVMNYVVRKFENERLQ